MHIEASALVEGPALALSRVDSSTTSTPGPAERGALAALCLVARLVDGIDIGLIDAAKLRRQIGVGLRENLQRNMRAICQGRTC